MESPLEALFFLIFVLVLQTVDNNLIYPKIVGKSVGIPGILVLISVIVGGNIGGLLGVLLGVPIASALYAIAIDWMSAKKQSKLDDESITKQILENSAVQTADNE